MRRTNFAAWCATWVCLILPVVAFAQPNQDQESHLATLRSRLDDPSLTVEARAQLVLEIATALDRAAQNATTNEIRRERWTEAIKRLEEFESKNPGHLHSREFQFQMALLLWARGEVWAQQAEFANSDRQARDYAIENLDASIVRFRGLKKLLPNLDDAMGQNVRFRLAQALADRAAFDAESSEGRKTKESEAIQLLDRPMTDSSLQGFAGILKGKLLSRLGKEGEAEQAFASAEKSASPPPASEILDARMTSLADRGRYVQALSLVDRSNLNPSQKGYYAIRVLLGQREASEDAEEKGRIESEIYRRFKPLRSLKAPEARLASISLGKRINKPGPGQSTEAWDILAEGAAAVGDYARAGELEIGAAERSLELGKSQGVGELRLRAGAYLFQAGKFLEAEAILEKVATDPLAGAARPKAGLLRILANGQALALKLPKASSATYQRALEYQIREFAGDPSANEARWLLGKLRLANSDREGARTLWASIARSDPRWLEARLDIAELNQEDLDTQRLNNDLPAIQAKYDKARAFLTATMRESRDASERALMDLATARLELTPAVGHPDEARALCEGVLRVAGRPEQRDKARRLKIVAMTQQNHFLEAESAARAESTWSRPVDLLATARLLDLVASGRQSDLRVRRVGLILRLLMAPVIEHSENLSDVERAEARMRETRALTMIGDEARARSSLMNWGVTPPTLDDAILRDLADTYSKLGAYNLAADVQRLRVRRAAVGSLPWFEARYGLALAYYRWGKDKDARKLIDATSILHPDLGGGELRDKFVQLRQRLGGAE